MKRLFFTTLLSGFGAAIGLQVFVWQSPWLIQAAIFFLIALSTYYQ